MTKRAGIVSATVVSAIALVTASLASAAPDPLARCCAGKLRAAATAERKLIACHAVAARRGAAVDASCVAAVGTALEQAFAKVEASGGCAGVGDAPLVRADLERIVSGLASALRPVSTKSVCAAQKLRAAGRLATADLRASAQLAPHPADRLAELEPIVTGLIQRMTQTFARLEAQGGCLTTGDAASVATAVVTGASAPQVPDGVLRTTLQACGRCGEGVRGGGEECDGIDSASCQGVCRPDCTCPPPPACGNGVRETGEECDGADLGACLGCEANCTCTPSTPICGNGIVEPGEQCDGTSFGSSSDPECTSAPGLATPGCQSNCECCALGACSAFGFDVTCCPGYTCPQRIGPNHITFCRRRCQTAAECAPGEICHGDYECRTPNCTSDTQCSGGTCFGGVCCYVLPMFGFVCP
jgi:hypothetical protein